MSTGVEATLAVVSVGLAIPDVIDLCINYGSFLKDKYDLYKNMDKDMKLYNLICNLVDGEMHDVLMFFNAVDSILSDDFRGQIKILLLQLEAELAMLKALVKAKPAVLEKLNYSVHKAKKIDKKCTSLEEWHVRFLRRATVLVLFGNFSPNTKDKSVEEAAARAIQRIKRIREAVVGPSPDDMFHGKLPDGAELEKIKDSSAMILTKLEASPSIAEFRLYGSSSDVDKKNASRYIIQELASKLAGANPSTMGILRSTGFYDDALKNRFVLQFEFPAGRSKLRTLQDLLTDKENQKDLAHSLSDRINLAKKIASGLLFVHAGGFVHKKVNPINVFVFETETETYPDHIGEPYLTGFDLVRKADHASARLMSNDWKENIYLHPNRHRLQPGDEFTMLHDIYSLGVVLLEIACWSSFTDLNRIGKYLVKSHTVKEDGKDVVKSKHLGPDDLKKQYLRLAKIQIPPNLGSNYYELVKSCLEGLPNEDGTPRNSTALVGSSYMEQVMGKLEEINL